MERNTESEDLVLPMSRSSQAECLKVEDPELKAVEDDTANDLKRRNVHTRSEENSQASKRSKVGNTRSLDGSKKRKRIEGDSVISSEPDAKRNRRNLETAAVRPSSSGILLNFVKPGVTEDHQVDGNNANNHESSDDSEPLINKINKNAAKRAQLRVKKTAPAKSTVVSPFQHPPNNSPQHEVNSFQMGRESVYSKHNFPGLKDFSTKSLRTSKKKNALEGKNEGGATFASGNLQLPTKTRKNAKKPTTDPVSPVSDHKTQQNLFTEVKNSTLKWSTHKARQNLSGSGNRPSAKKTVRNALPSQSGNVRLNVVTDEQDSLEQYAARTLSSRFSSHGGAFAGTSSNTADDLQSDHSASGLLAVEKDERIAGRALRPRKRRQKADGTKRYREISFSDADAFHILNRRIKVFWPLDNKWYYGMVRSYDPTNKLHYVRYDDRDEEWLQLRDEKFKLQLLPGETAGRVKLLEKSGSGKVEGRFVDGTQLVSKTLPSSELNNELGTADNGGFMLRSENGSFDKSAPTLLDDSGKSRREDVDCSCCTSGSNLELMKDNDTEKSAFNNPDNKPSRKVYVRRRYRNTCSKGIGEGISKFGEEKGTGFHKLDEPVILPQSSTGQESSSAQGTECFRVCETADTPEDGKNELSETLEDNSKHLHSVDVSQSLKVQQHTCKEPSNEKGLEKSHIDKNNVVLSEILVGSGKGFQRYSGFEILPWLTDSSGDYLPAGVLDLTNRHFVFPEELDFGNPFISLQTMLLPLYPRCGLPSVCCHNNLVLRQRGVLMSVWPDVWLDIMVVDDFVGSRLYSFGGSLHKVVNAFSKILASFMNPLKNQYSCMFLEAVKITDFKLPVPSLSFRFLLSQGLGKPLDFVFYDFQGITRARWNVLFKTLEAICSFHKNYSPRSPCNANSQFLQSYSGQVSGMPAFSGIVMFMKDTGITSTSRMHVPLLKSTGEISIALQDRNSDLLDIRIPCRPQFQKVICQDLYQSTSPVRRRNGCVLHIENDLVVPPFFLTFAAAPSFFIGLHLKLLLGKPVNPAGFQSNSSDSSELENSERIDLSELGGCDPPTMQVSSKRTSQTFRGAKQIHIETPEGYLDGTVFTGDHALDSSARVWSTPKLSKVDVDASPISTADGWVISPRSSYSELNVTGTAAGLTAKQDNLESFVHGNAFKLQRCPTNRSTWRLTGNSRSHFGQRMKSRVKEIEAGSSFKDGEREHDAGQSFHGYFESMHGQSDPKQDQLAGYADTLTTPGNYWSRDKFGITASSQLWQHAYNGFVEPRKRRSGFSNLIFSENADGVPFRYRGHMRRGRPSRQNKEDKLKKTADNSSDLTYLDSVSCSANILVVVVDRGWRESGAQIVLEASEHNEWMLSVKTRGFTKYSHKAQQVVQSGSTNRYTHAMIWKGGKDWSLEFPDRKQWALFKEMHEECYNRNLRAASVKHIPIPGVREIEDYDCGSDSFHFVRPSSRYIRQMETEVEMALATSRVMYDMDSEDEEWLGHLNNSRIGDGSCPRGHVSEETFERIIDLLEKAAFTQQRELLNSDEVADFCWDIAPVEVVKAIHAHWQEKRWRKGMALVRHFQPASWERYQQQIKEWESLMNELQNSPTAHKQQLNLERPPMFAFCLKPRGLEVPNKSQKQRSHRKFNAGQQITLRDQENGALPAIRKHNGISIGEDTSSDALGIFQHSSPSEIETYSQPASFGAVSSEATTQVDSMDIRLKMSKAYQQKQKMKRKSKKMKVFTTSRDPQPQRTSHCELDNRRQYVYHGWEFSSGGDQMNNSSCALAKYNLPSMNSGHTYTGSDFDAELRVQEATNATRSAAELAAMKRARAQRLLQKADLISHKAAVAVVIAETIRAAERDGQEGSHSDVDKTMSEHVVDMCRQKVSSLAVPFARDSRPSETNSLTEESGRAFLGHLRPTRVDSYAIKDDGTMRQSPNCSVPASLPSTSCFMPKMQADIMSVTTIGSSSIKKDSESNQVPVTAVEESLMPNDALLPIPSWGHEINT